eukprot:CAMPEP_0115266934 /NCGR_PEP_ID=MMETSP0270-20121206/51728_1 /TAXON_ID=71861 /ORGANISM="Scrippsiella trochoidea, Strain CCMP3099" /LENGTH=375 /DNA_ID=CAMNT_0002683055 /DNA_START=68 /DNA_END=1191 /DNA_ORIENTATION=+
MAAAAAAAAATAAAAANTLREGGSGRPSLSASRAVPRRLSSSSTSSASSRSAGIAAGAPLEGSLWVDPHSCTALCQLILDDRKGGANAPAARRRALPPMLYAEHVAPFLRFDQPLPNMLYAFGGRSQRRGSLASVEMFDTWHGQWVPCPPMPARRAGGGAAMLPDGRLLVVGGYDERGIVDGLLDRCDVYNPVRRCWEEDGAAPLSRARWGHGCAALAGQVFVVGGCSLQRGSREPREAFMETLRACEVYSPKENVWQPCAPLQVPRSGSRVVALGEQHLLAVGGCDDVFGRAETQPTAELFDLSTGRWTVLGSQLAQPRTTAGVAAVDGGRIIFGGAPSLASAEVYQVPHSRLSAQSDGGEDGGASSGGGGGGG